MATEFHLFSALPTELRHEIWNLAIHPKEPGVHIFRVYGNHWDHQAPEAVRFSYHTDRFPGWGLAVPLPHEDAACANKPSAKSVSTYMTDMGLWTACRESMAMMCKAFPRPRSIKFGRVCIPEPVMGYYISGGAPLYFTMNPLEDLLILRSDSSELYLEKNELALAFSSSQFGIEYEADWGRQLYEYNHDRGGCRVFDELSNLYDTWNFRCLLLVDYNLKRTADAPPYDDLCFNAGNRRLIRVDFLDEHDRNHWEYIEPVPDKDKKSSFAFAEQLHACFEEMQESNERLREKIMSFYTSYFVSYDLSTAFHLFSALPTELRLQIWKDAIRPRLPAAHFVRVRGSDVPDPPQNTIHFRNLRSVDRQLSHSDCIAIQSWSKYLDGNDHGSDFDVSAYLIDAGLWTACRESRLMMQESFLYNAWHGGSWMGYSYSGGAPLYITIRPWNDLVILQPDKFFLGNFDDETLGRLHKLEHIGIEYRPEWGMVRWEEDETSEQAFVFADIYCFGEVVRHATCVWLIDHNLRRKADAPPYVEGCNTLPWVTRHVSFYAADRKFSSIDLDNKNEDSLTHWEYINPVADGDYQKSSLHFAHRMHRLYVNRNASMQAVGPNFGLLGWDHL
ncbi:hypothetical protein FCIRC_7817 [Fusarium circinatum]|uniref:2EXR domain-containing protein n=1 Tax=Fusarium circinatum TaxID=48490 RepID=A0A8H5TSA4_FUSCI|nr:hypothetical protein FCIRC_7817 [Fusarium circinatum]